MKKQINKKKLPKYAIGFGGYASKTLSGAGTGLSIGSNPALMAATGGLSAPIGAVIGAGVGVLGASKEDQAIELAMKNNKIASDMSIINNAGNQMQAEYDIKNPINNRVPGFKKGKSRIKANALVSNGEVTRNGITGELNVMPGNFNPNEADKIPVSMNESDSVYSDSNSMLIPGGETPADLMKRAYKAQKRADDILSGKVKGGPLDKKEALRTKAKVEDLSGKMDMHTMVANYGKEQELPKYAKGKPGSYNNPKLDRVTPKYGLSPMMNEILPERTIGEVVYNANKDMLRRVASPAIDINNNTISRIFKETNYLLGLNDGNDIYNKAENDFSNEIKIKKVDARTGANSSNYTTSVSTESNTDTNTPNKATQSSSKPLSAQSNTNVPQVNSTPQIALKSPSGLSNSFMPGGKNFAGMNDIYDHLLKKISQPSISLPAANPPSITAALSNTPKYSATGTSKTGKAQPISKPGFNLNPEAIGSIGSTIAQLAPVVSNLFSGSIETFQPVFESYINPNQRYNISPYIQESLKQRQISRYNQASNKGQGGSMAYGANIYSQGQEQLSKIMNQADIANAEYRSKFADRFNQASSNMANELRRIKDLNSRSIGAKEATMNAGLSQLSEFAQNKELMNNMKNNDMMNANIWGAYASSLDPKTKEELMKYMNSRVNSGKLFIKKGVANG